MFEFKRGKRKNYKSERKWLEGIYRRNKEILKEKGISQAQFLNWIEFRKNTIDFNNPLKKKTTIQALKDLANSEAFTPYRERAKVNLISGLKKHGLYDRFRELIKVKGKYTAIDTDKLQYIGDGNYCYDNRIMIEISQSPEWIDLRVIG